MPRLGGSTRQYSVPLCSAHWAQPARWQCHSIGCKQPHNLYTSRMQTAPSHSTTKVLGPLHACAARTRSGARSLCCKSAAVTFCQVNPTQTTQRECCLEDSSNHCYCNFNNPFTTACCRSTQQSQPVVILLQDPMHAQLRWQGLHTDTHTHTVTTGPAGPQVAVDTAPRQCWAVAAAAGSESHP